MVTKLKKPKIVMQDGKPKEVILDIDEYQKMLELIEDIEDARELMEMRKHPEKLTKFADFLSEYSPDV